MKFALVHSPLVGPTTWRRVADALSTAGHETVVPDLRAAAASTSTASSPRPTARCSSSRTPNAAALYLVDPATGDSSTIEGVSVPNVDGIVLSGHRLWAVQNFSNQISAWNLAPDWASGVLDHVITSPDFQIPTTAIRHGSRLAAVNARFDTGFPPTAEDYEVVIVPS